MRTLALVLYYGFAWFLPGAPVPEIALRVIVPPAVTIGHDAASRASDL